MSHELEHILLTRFNLPSPGPESLVRAKPGWLRERVALFERYCLPSVRAQTVQEFTWVVYVDPASPDWFLDWVAEHTRAGHFHAIARETVPRAELLADIRSLTGTGSGMLLTTNLDNDDGLAVDFVARLQAAARPDGRHALYLTRGLVRSPRGLYLRTDRHNAFCSVSEPWDDPVTCWADWHNRLHRIMDVVEVGGAPAWLQVVHSSNVSNRARGRLVSPLPYRPRFPAVLDDLPVPAQTDLLRDRTVGRWSRAVTESGRAVAKQAVLAIGGKRGLDRVKTAVSSLRAARN